MEKLTHEEASKLVLESTALRKRERYDEAINIIIENIDKFDDDLKITGYLTAFYAARDSGDILKTKKYAEQVAKLDPDVPSIKGYI